MTSANSRTSDHEIDPLYLERWSPRAYTGEPIPMGELQRLFEAARWAPSSYNSQPWRFLFARRDTPHWEKFLGILNEFNQSWAKNASALIIVVSKKTMMVPGKDVPIESYSHSFDTGAAWGYFALEAARLGWAAHGMVGLDQSRAAIELHVAADHRVEMAIAVGKRADKSTLPEAMAAREAPSPRNPQTQFALEGGFPTA